MRQIPNVDVPEAHAPFAAGVKRQRGASFAALISTHCKCGLRCFGRFGAVRRQAVQTHSPNSGSTSRRHTAMIRGTPPWDSVSPSQHEPHFESLILQKFVPFPFNHLPLHVG